MANLSKFHVVCTPSTLIRLNKGALEGHLCQTVNIYFFDIPQDANIIWDANISLSVIYLSPFIGTFILWDVDNLLVRLISEEHRQSMVDSNRKL